MPPAMDRQEIPCALCGPGAPYKVRFAERIEVGSVDFAARKTPTRQHFRMVECSNCGLIYSSPILPPEVIYELYRHSPFLHESQLSNMIRDYQDQVRSLLPLLPSSKGRLLEIGCANGLFLKAAMELGFEDVRGVEPGEKSVRAADPAVRDKIVNALFRADLFPPESFDVVCCFQVLDHLLDPAAVLRDASKLLRKGGLVLLLNHNIRSWLPRVLGERCPMYDIEHIYLFDKQTVAQLLQNNGFEVVGVRNIPNSYTLSYAIKMFPFPGLVKRLVLSLCSKVGMDSVRLRLPAGNMVSIGRKPETAVMNRAA
jgi:2-polyprenyl-3-methyl-5-hydroxy-6-metoxy-1,4-benzoquinol methylase